MTKSTGLRTDPWGIPLSTSCHAEFRLLILTRCLRLDRKSWIQSSKGPQYLNTWINQPWGTLSNAFIKSQYITSTHPFFFQDISTYIHHLNQLKNCRAAAYKAELVITVFVHERHQRISHQLLHWFTHCACKANGSIVAW